MKKFFFIFVSLLSLLLRSISAYHSWYVRDHARVFDLGFQLYKYHILPIQGSPVVDTNSLLPGSLQAILSAIPLYLSNGNPYSIILFAQLFNFIACLLIYKTYRYLFPNLNKYLMFSFIVLNPMNIIFSYGWNLSFIILFSSLFFFGLVKVCFNKKSQMGSFLILFPLLFMFQLNLQCAIFAVLAFVFLLKKIIPFPSLKMIFISVFPGLITLFPMIVNKVYSHKIVTSNWNMTANVFSNIQFHPMNVFSYFHVLARFISYSTGDTSRNLADKFILHHPQLWLFFVIGMIGTIFVFFFSVLFYLKLNNWRIFFKKNYLLLPQERVDLALIYLPIIATILFVFSSVPPSTHTIWSLFPFSFYPFFTFMNQRRIIFLIRMWLSRFYKYKFKIYAIYLASVLIYSVIGSAYLPSTYKEIITDSKYFCKSNSQDKINSYIQLEGDATNTKEYTMSLLCQYWK